MTVDESSAITRSETTYRARTRDAAFRDYLRTFNQVARTAIAPTATTRTELARLAAGGWTAERLAAFIRTGNPDANTGGIAATLIAIPSQPVDPWTPPAPQIPPGYYRDDELAAGAGIHHHGDDRQPSDRQPEPAAACCDRRYVHTPRCAVAPNRVIAKGTRLP